MGRGSLAHSRADKEPVALATSAFLLPKKPPRVATALTFFSGHRMSRACWGVLCFQSQLRNDWSLAGVRLFVGRRNGLQSERSRYTMILHARCVKKICCQAEYW